MLTLQEIKEKAPSVFTTQPSPNVSNKYVFVPTIDIVDKFQSQGWDVHSVRQNGKGVFGVHELRLRNGELPKVGDSLVEAVIQNSHNGMGTFSLKTGLFRLVCSNGLTVPTSVSESFKIRHQRFDLEEIKKLTDSFAVRLPLIQGSVSKMMDRTLDMDEKVDFVKKASVLKWGVGSVPAKINMEEILNPLRRDDEGNSLWNVFNVVQEKFVKGGFTYTTDKGRKTSLKGLKNIMAVNAINTGLWNLAEQMV